MSLPKTAIGLFAFILFAGWMLAYSYPGAEEKTSLPENIERMGIAQTDLVNAADGITESDSIIGSLSGVAEVFLNVIILVSGFFFMIFSSLAGFIAVITDLPIAISQIFIALLTLGTIFAFISKLVETKS